MGLESESILYNVTDAFLCSSTMLSAFRMARVFIPPQLRELTGGAGEVSADGGTVREVVDALEAQYPGLRERLCRDGELAPALQVSIDHVMSQQGLRAKVGPDSELHFLPAFGGG